MKFIFKCLVLILLIQQALFANELNEAARLDDSQIGIPVGEELFITLIIDSYSIGEVIAIKTEDGARVGLTTLVELLDFPIDVSIEPLDANGWYIKEANNFKLTLGEDGQTLEIETAKGRFLLNRERYELTDDLYVESSDIEKWLGIKLAYQFNDLLVSVSSEEPLPLQEKLARQDRKIKHSSARAESILPEVDNSYSASSTPLFDTQLSYIKSKNSKSNYNFSVLGSQDLAFLGAQYYLSGSNFSGGLSNARIKLFRDSQDNDLLGPLAASRFEFGDVNAVSYGGQQGQVEGRGFRISRLQQGGVRDNSTTDFVGDIQPGWDVELYRNNILVANQLSLADGRYEFYDIELFFGDNNFELVFYGPQGQRRTEEKAIYFNGNALDEGQFSYDVSLNEAYNPLIDLSDREPPTSYYSLSGKYSYGLNDDLTSYFGHSFIFDRENIDNPLVSNVDAEYVVGVDATIMDEVLAKFEYVANDLDENRLITSVKTNFWGQSVNANYTKTKKVSRREGIEFDTVDSVSANFSGFFDLLDINYQNNFSYSESDFVKSQYFQNSLGATIFSNRVSHTFFWNQSETEGLSSIFSGGEFILSPRLRGFSTRLNMNYSIKPETELVSVKSDFDWSINENLTTRLSLERSLLLDLDTARLGLNWGQKYLSTNTNISYNSNDDWHLSFSTNFSFGYHAEEDIYFLNRARFASGGSMLVRVFEDLNANGLFDRGEPEIPKAKIVGLQNFRRTHTNDDGLALLVSMPANRTTDIVVDENTLDPFMRPLTEGIAITPRNGYLTMLDVPIVRTSELEGSIFIQTEQGAEFADLVKLELVDLNGKVVAVTRSEYDGFFLFLDIKPGKYKLRVNPDYLKKHKLKNPQPIDVAFSAKGDVVMGMDITLEKKEIRQGFVVKNATFNSLKMLKVYWAGLDKRYKPLFKHHTFYTKDKMVSKYHLMLAFLETEQAAIDYCQMLNDAVKLNCQVEPMEFAI
ncbi:hypothetical protein HR060_02195 [Catenovulum sp. SM1970]|uniref:hypothetical protein n=1 Tax=Marinifaba aquimaris TaxID=2741323 RepID=UPI001572422E|nr:hypothetical protein [Marinifaba aquimaris]NTS75666.1 hypothetical protein [Marinifaba aquimaris]